MRSFEKPVGRGERSGRERGQRDLEEERELMEKGKEDGSLPGAFLVERLWRRLARKRT